MKFQRCPPAGLVVLSAALAFFSSDAIAGTSSTSSGCKQQYATNGFCDDMNNTEECGFDGGDCCSCTCVSGDFACGEDIGFTCLDTSAECFGDDTGSDSSPCTPSFFSDGDCDLSNNSEECGYDGGDCCECTCVSTSDFTCGDRDNGGFSCLDPNAPCVDDDDVTILPSTESFPDDSTTTTLTVSCNPDFVSDGDCDLINNTEECGYDGGDCCECTCVSTSDFTCGDRDNGGFSCLDPSAPCVDDDDVTTLPSTESFPDDSTRTTTQDTCITDFVSDGDCDLINNTEECGYDGGDCCECTCVSTDSFTCGDAAHGGFTCLDPSAPCVDDDDATTLPTMETFTGTTTSTTTSSSCLTDFFSDGDCDPANNNEACGYDSGDCCECTCVSTPDFTCGDDSHGGFACVDPSASCVDDDDYIPGEDDFLFDDDDDFSASFTFEPCVDEFISDGDCDSTNNNEECGYDGGDCCECTCVSTDVFTCGVNGFDCADPTSACSAGNIKAIIQKQPIP